MSTTFDDAFEKLTRLTNWEQKKPGSRHRIDLSGTIALLERLGKPQARLKSVAQVAGSKGKGSTVTLLAGMAEALGLRAATYMSPHVVDPRERIQVAGRAVDADVFAEAVTRVEAVLAPEQTWYEAYTAVAILCFAACEVDLCVLEVGLGGRLDATTVVPKQVCAITGIELEHTHVLGDTIEAIAKEKAGILRPGVPCVSGCKGVADEVVVACADRVGSALSVRGRDFDAQIVERTPRSITVDWSHQSSGVELRIETPLRASYHVSSFALALAMLEELRPGAAVELFDSRGAAMRDAKHDWVRRALPPGRFDVLREDPPIVVDGAHTDASLASLADELEACFKGRRFRLIFGIALGKRFREGLGRLLRLVDKATVVPLSGKASVDPHELTELFAARGVSVDTAEDVDAALRAALQLEGNDGLCITGSLYAAGDALRTLRERG